MTTEGGDQFVGDGREPGVPPPELLGTLQRADDRRARVADLLAYQSQVPQPKDVPQHLVRLLDLLRLVVWQASKRLRQFPEWSGDLRLACAVDE
jgi:hypothetical protein